MTRVWQRIEQVWQASLKQVRQPKKNIYIYSRRRTVPHGTCNGRRKVIAVLGLGVKHDVRGRDGEVAPQRVHQVDKAAWRRKHLVLPRVEGHAAESRGHTSLATKSLRKAMQ